MNEFEKSQEAPEVLVGDQKVETPAPDEINSPPSGEVAPPPKDSEIKRPKRAPKSPESPLKEKQSKESIEASIQEKLSRRSDEGEIDPFVPLKQLQNEVIQVAKDQGFHLTRGTEAGAALMARARRRPHS